MSNRRSPSATIGEASVEVRPDTGSRPETVVVVDDTAQNRALVRYWLELNGYLVAEAASGEQLFGLLHAVTPDLVVLDVNLGGMSGLEACRRLKADPSTARIPVLQTSAVSVMSDDRVEALDGGADAYVTFPVPPGEFLATVRALLRMRRAERDLEHAWAEAEAANRAKSEFISRMSHELRTPLNAIIGFGQLLSMSPLPPDAADSAAHVLKAGRHLLAMVNELLDLATIEAGRLDLSIEPVRVADVIDDVMGLVAPMAADAGVSLHRGTDAPGHVVHADRQRLNQVMLNLLSNAIKYNRTAGEVRVSVEPHADGIAISVADTGIGIRPELVERLFDPFERLDAKHTAVEGTGLGLTLVRRLTEAMDGEVSLNSVPGDGSSFTVTLPRGEEGAATGTGLSPAPAPTAPARGRRTVVYIEDNLTNVTLVSRVLASRPDVEVVTALQGRLGLDLAAQVEPDLVLLDLHLPDMEGTEVLQRLRGDSRTAAIPVVMLSADANPHQIERLVAAGAAAYLSKPFDVVELLATIDRLLPGEHGP